MNVTLPELVESDGRHMLHYKLADILWRCSGSAAHAADGRGTAPSASTNHCLVRIEAQFAGKFDGHEADAVLLAMESEVILWMVVHEDTHGNRHMIKSNLSECAADALMAGYGKNYQHKQEYYKFCYTPSTRTQVMLDQGVRE